MFSVPGTFLFYFLKESCLEVLSKVFWAVLGLHCCAGFSLVVVSWGPLFVQASHCGGFSSCRAPALGCVGSVVAVPRL